MKQVWSLFSVRAWDYRVIDGLIYGNHDKKKS